MNLENVRKVFLSNFNLCWEPGFFAETGTTGTGTETQETGTGATETGTQETKSTGKTYTEAEFNSHTANLRRKHEAQLKQNISKLEEFQKNVQLSVKEKQDLETQLETLRTQTMSTEELARRNAEKLKADYEAKLTATSEESKLWKGRYTDASIRRAIVDAATLSGAFNPAQVEAILKPQTTLVENVGEDGKPNGEFTPRVKFNDIGKDKKPIVLDLTIPEAVNRMLELKEIYGNLFKTQAKAGIGGNNASGGASNQSAPKDFAAYTEWRKSHPL